MKIGLTPSLSTSPPTLGSVPFSNTLSTDFDGIDESGSIDAGALIIASDTVGGLNFWMKVPDTTPTAAHNMIHFSDTSGVRRLRFFLDSSGILVAQLYASGGNSWGIHTTQTDLVNDTWAMITLVQDGVSPFIAINNVVVPQAFHDTNNITIWMNDINVLVPIVKGSIASTTFGSDFYSGNIDEYTVYDSPPSVDDIAELYGTGSPSRPLDHTLTPKLYYRLGDGDTFPTILDSSGNSADGVLINMESGDFVLDVP